MLDVLLLFEQYNLLPKKAETTHHSEERRTVESTIICFHFTYRRESSILLPCAKRTEHGLRVEG